jgi:hypothetical protein
MAERYLYKLEIISLHSKSPDRIGEMQQGLIEVYCWAMDAREAISTAEAEAILQHIPVDAVKNVVNTEIPLSAFIMVTESPILNTN